MRPRRLDELVMPPSCRTIVDPRPINPAARRATPRPRCAARACSDPGPRRSLGGACPYSGVGRSRPSSGATARGSRRRRERRSRRRHRLQRLAGDAPARPPGHRLGCRHQGIKIRMGVEEPSGRAQPQTPILRLPAEEIAVRAQAASSPLPPPPMAQRRRRRVARGDRRCGVQQRSQIQDLHHLGMREPDHVEVPVDRVASRRES